MMSLTAWPTPSSDTTKIDSTARVSVLRWKWIRVLEISRYARACDTVVQKLQTELAFAGRTITAADSVIAVKNARIDIGEQETKLWHDRYDNQVVTTDKQRGKKRRWIWRCVGVTVLFITVEVVDYLNDK